VQVAYWAEKGQEGLLVYKYMLKRRPGQLPLSTRQVTPDTSRPCFRFCLQRCLGEIPIAAAEREGEGEGEKDRERERERERDTRF
jgi:hypothetical protein